MFHNRTDFTNTNLKKFFLLCINGWTYQIYIKFNPVTKRHLELENFRISNVTKTILGGV
jgi:hypothetical protein